MNVTKYMERAYKIAHDINCNTQQLNKKAMLINGQYMKLELTSIEEFEKLVADEKSYLDKLEEYKNKVYAELEKEDYRAFSKEVKRIMGW